MIPVTKPYLPKKQAYLDLIDEIFERVWLTNDGPVLRRLEKRLRDHLSTEYLSVVGNGTIALQLAIKALQLRGEIITTPFSYVASTSSIVWENCTPVFVDIDSETLNIDPQKIENAINSKTSAILATHCFGNACDIEKIEKIASKNNLKVIYDASHCFETKYKSKSIFSYGDISTTSLHATKLMHSVEGGVVFTKDIGLLERINYLRNFGHDGPEKFNGVGINGKNSEFHAAMGIAVLNDIDIILQKRKLQSKNYDLMLNNGPFRRLKIQKDCTFNYAYYPIIFDNERLALKIKTALEANEIYPRRYFYPSLNKLNYVNAAILPIAEKVSSSILCLPLYHDLTEEEQKFISDLINSSLSAE